MTLRKTALTIATWALAAAFVTMAAWAAPPDFTEEDIPPPSVSAPAPAAIPNASPAKPAKAKSEKSASSRAHKEKVAERVEKEKSERLAEKNERASEHQSDATERENGARTENDKADKSAKKERDGSGVLGMNESGELSYKVRSGDTAGSIAEMFHIDTARLLQANNLGASDVLRNGDTIKVPNPLAGKVQDLQAQVQQLNQQIAEAKSAAQNMPADVQTLRAQLDELNSHVQPLRHDAHLLPWWRAAAITAAAAAALMLVLAGLALFDWFMLRRKFHALVEMNESLRRLDSKYKAVLAKAELRFQQLYGRRRQGAMDGQNFGKTEEEFELERLNQELKELLKQQLERLGASSSNGGKRSRLRDLLGGGVDSPVAARSERRP